MPTHQWKLEEIDAPYVDTYGDANGTCGGDCPTQVSGIIGNAQLFDGTNDEINVVDDGTFDWAVGDSFTIEFWMKPDTAATDNPDVAIARVNTSNIWWIGRNGNNIQVDIDGGITSASPIDTNGSVWTHVVVVRNATSSELKLYINGTIDTTANITPSDYSGDAAINIGWYNDVDYNTDYFFSGALDEITVYNGVLSKDQIKQHFDTQGLNILPTAMQE